MLSLDKEFHSKQKIIFCLSLALLLCLCSVSPVFAAMLLKKGSRGANVTTAQMELQNAGYSLSVDGIFGEETRRAVLAFQRAHKLKVSGKIDAKTWSALQQYADGNRDTGTALNTQKVIVKESAPFVPQSDALQLIATARKYLGVRYVFGGTSPKSGFDCSGYVQYVFRACGYSIPRTADVQFEIGKKTSSSRELVPGDLVFFTTYEPGASHVGIYLGDGKFIHASSSRGVTISSLSDEYYRPRYYGGKKVVITGSGTAAAPPASTPAPASTPRSSGPAKQSQAPSPMQQHKSR